MIETLEQLEAEAIKKGLLVERTTQVNAGKEGFFIYDTYRLENPDIIGPLFGWDIPTALELINEYGGNTNEPDTNIET